MACASEHLQGHQIQTVILTLIVMYGITVITAISITTTMDAIPTDTANMLIVPKTSSDGHMSPPCRDHWVQYCGYAKRRRDHGHHHHHNRHLHRHDHESRNGPHPRRHGTAHDRHHRHRDHHPGNHHHRRNREREERAAAERLIPVAITYALTLKASSDFLMMQRSHVGKLRTEQFQPASIGHQELLVSNGTIMNPQAPPMPNVTITIGLGIAMLVVGLVGIFGSGTSVYIFSRDQFASPFGLLTLGSCCAELIMIILSVITFACPSIGAQYDEHPAMMSYLSVTAVTTYPVMHVAQTYFLWLYILITIERYTAISNPFQARRSMSKRKVRYILLGVLVLDLAYSMPRFWEWNPYLSVIRHSNTTITTTTSTNHSIHSIDHNGALADATTSNGSLAASPTTIILVEKLLLKSKTYLLVYFTILYILTQYAIPLCILLALNVCIICIVHKATKKRKKCSNNQRTNYRTGIMVTIITGKFMLLRSLPCILNIINAAKHDLFEDAQVQHIAYTLMDVSNVLAILNLASNWLIYYAFNQRFREYFQYIYCKRPLSYGSTLKRIADGPAMTAFLSFPLDNNNRTRVTPTTTMTATTKVTTTSTAGGTSIRSAADASNVTTTITCRHDPVPARSMPTPANDLNKNNNNNNNNGCVVQGANRFQPYQM